MNYGPYTPLVEEVLDFARCINAVPKLDVPARVALITDREQAEHLAYEEVYGEDEYTWSDIKQREMAAVRGKQYRLKEEKPPGLAGLSERIADLLRGGMPDLYSGHFENVVVDLRNCAVHRAVQGETSGFYETMFDIYRSGGLPCGWVGAYPGEGRIAAFFPEVR